MKKLASALCALLLCLGCTVSASAYANRIIDYALYTDIVATVNGHTLRSYNIGGSTAVVAEDLMGYGFRVIWDATARTLRISLATKDGEPELPSVWPSYQPEALTQRIGARAKPVYETDIVTYAAGGVLDSFNINGETLVWIDDLAPFGEVVWHPEERVISLTLGDPVEIALAPLIVDVELWKSIGGPGSSWETVECKTGTLLTTRYTGTPHGGTTTMLFLSKSGDHISINNLLPNYVWGSGNYLAPREIAIDEAGTRLSFVTPVQEMADVSGLGDVKYLGDCRCVVDLLNGTLLSLEPLSAG